MLPPAASDSIIDRAAVVVITRCTLCTQRIAVFNFFRNVKWSFTIYPRTCSFPLPSAREHCLKTSGDIPTCASVCQYCVPVRQDCVIEAAQISVTCCQWKTASPHSDVYFCELYITAANLDVSHEPFMCAERPNHMIWPGLSPATESRFEQGEAFRRAGYLRSLGGRGCIPEVNFFRHRWRASTELDAEQSLYFCFCESEMMPV
jgi:hypothetical protein